MVIVDYTADGVEKTSSGVVAPHVDGKSKLTVVAVLTGQSGTLLEVRGKLMFEVG